ncbi:MAG TPA: hypothetical protein VN157_10470 [Caulobacter sp.]|nr:hypothetical protein [Caulobacter sp.]
MIAPALLYVRGRWPEPDVPDGTPLWVFYEIDEKADAILRDVQIYPDGRITRNSVVIEQRNGDDCPSLTDQSLRDGFFDWSALDAISSEDFEELWEKGDDKPFWFP